MLFKTKLRILFGGVLLIAAIHIITYFYELKTNFKFKTKITWDSRGIKTELKKIKRCKIPVTIPLDALFLKHVVKPKPFRCGNLPPLVASSLNTLYVKQKHLATYNVTNKTKFYCCYQDIKILNNIINSTNHGAIRVSNYCKKFTNKVRIENEFVRIICKREGKKIYEDFHSFVPIKRKIQPNINKPNVLIIGIDSVSRENLHRQMPKTVEFLTKNLNAHELLGYNKIGENTFPNLMAILTGHSVEELTESCWPTHKSQFDNCPFIWKNFSQAGYLTSFAEDAAIYGLFTYFKGGFKVQPTDYYWTTYSYFAEKLIGHNKQFNTNLCLGPKPLYRVLLEYTRKFTLSMKNIPFFGFFFGTSLTHDDINYPALGDKDYELLLKDLQKMNVFDNTILIFLSDHGMRWGVNRVTIQGYFEERLPFLFLAFPKWFNIFHATAIEQLQRNTRQLTTPFDLHETLNDIINYEQLTNNNIGHRSEFLDGKRGISLFLPIPNDRTCLSANISPHWCTCHKNIVTIAKNDTYVLKGADFIVKHINNLLESYKDCSKLYLHSIIDSRWLLSVNDDFKINNFISKDLLIIINTFPGYALFESTVRFEHHNGTDTFEILGTVSRLNLYHKQSFCVKDIKVIRYCYCINNYFVRKKRKKKPYKNRNK